MTPLASILVLAIAPATPATTRVSQVVVYPDRAQVTRSTAVACSGRTLARFEGITPAADASSFRARSSIGAVEGLASEQLTREESFAGEVKALDDQIRKLTRDQRALEDAIARGASQSRIAAGFENVAATLVGREMSESAPNVKAWGGALDLALQARLKASSEAIAARAKIRGLEHRLDDLRLQRSRLGHSAARREYSVEVLVGCPADQAGKPVEVALTYLVGGAAWEPAYEARADEQHGTVELSAFATVHQSTGEDWSRTQVILSTAVPRQDATPPELQPLRLYVQDRTPHRKVIVAREEQTQHAEAGPSGATTAAESGLRAAAQGLSVQLRVPESADVAGDGTPARLFVARHRMPARFALRSVPKRMPFAFRVADLANGAPFPLLPGPLDAYRKGALAARYPIERVAEGARFHLSFGLEEGIRLSRLVVEEVQRDAGLFGTTRRFRYRYRFEVGNYTGRSIELELGDQLPVSELDDVKVAIDSATTAGYQIAGDDGVVTWRLPLHPGERRKIEHAFHIDVPSSYDPR